MTASLPLKKALARFLLRTRLGAKIVRSKELWPYLESIGWFESRIRGVPVDGEGRSLPWLTYPAIRFLEKRVTADLRVFEYGSGSSTLWWSARVARVVSVEHDPAWFERMRPQVPANVEYLLRPLDDSGAYRDAILSFRGEIDLAVIDGRDRVACAANSARVLGEEGALLWDDSHRPEYAEGLAELEAKGMKRLDFEGISPLSARRGCTSVFYRSANRLGL